MFDYRTAPALEESVHGPLDRDRDRRDGDKGMIRIWVAALGAALVFLVVAAVFAIQTRDQTEPHIELVGEYAEAWFGGDSETFLAMLDLDAANSQGMIDWSQYEEAIGAEAELSCAPQTDQPPVYICQVEYSNLLYEAVGESPSTYEWVGRVEADDRSIQVLRYDSSPGPVEIGWSRWLSQTMPDPNPCPSDRPPDPACAAYQVEHLDEWVAWYTGT